MALVANHLVPVQCEQLEPGMYVAELDRSWLHTPFEARGFLITQISQIEALQRCCEYVYIDPKRSDAMALLDLEATRLGPAIPLAEPANDDVPPLNGCREFLHDATSRIAATVCAARRSGRLELDPIDADLDALVEHVLRWPDAIQWLLATESAHGYLNRRSLGTAVFSILFGRQLGLDREALRELALGALILDIGKTIVPITILAKPKRLNSVERSFARRHVEQSLTLVRLSTRVEPRVVNMVGAHHERLDGSGYPHGMTGTDIPLYARIAGIADTFDAMTQERSYATARSGHDALRHLNTWRDIKFDAAPVDEFIHALGVFPVGTGVELMDGSVGVVCRHNPGEPKRPDVLLTRDTHGHALKTKPIVEPGPNRRIQRALSTTMPAT
ncbi:MAG: HD-GYP domain-containing protein [Gammaproteobacteria bacterium]